MENDLYRKSNTQMNCEKNEEENSRNQEPANKPSRLTKILVHKIHGGRKQDSKFWNSEFSLANDISPRDTKNNKPKGRKNFPFISLGTGVFIIVLLIVVRPDLFSFLEYHNIYHNLIGSFSPKEPSIGKDINPISHNPSTGNKEIFAGISPDNYDSKNDRDLKSTPTKAKASSS